MRYIELNNELMMRGKDGFFQLEKDHEAAKEFENEVEERMLKFDSVKDRIDYMIANDFYYNVYEHYTTKQIEELHQFVYNYNFEFKSYMAISKFYKDYALKTDDKKNYLEYYEDRIAIVALYIGQGNFDLAMRAAKAMIEQRYQPATPTFLNAGKARRGEMVSCFLLGMDDSLNSINFNLSTCMQLSKIGGGVATNLSRLRGQGEPIKGVEGAAKGVLPVLKLMEDSFSYADQMGQRKGAGAAYLNIFHWDILDFLDTKKINADEKIRIKTLSIGVIVPDMFFKLAEKNEPFYVFAPYSVYKAYGQHLDDMDIDNMYDSLVVNPKVKKKRLDARDLLIKIAMTQLESGYPYIMFKSNANKDHALKGIGQVLMSNLCTEIFQLQEVSEINDYDEEDIIRRDINCNLGSLNIVNVMESKQIKDSVHVGMEMLTTVSDITEIKNAPTVRKANEELHSVGLGVMNLHGYLTKNRIMFESNDAKEFVRTFFMIMNYHSIEWSMEHAKKTGKTFKDFDKSEYANGNYFKMYFDEDFAPKSDKVKKLFEDIFIPSKEDWMKLAFLVKEYGLYNAYRLAIAPTQSISYVQNSTSSVMPIVDIIESRTYANSTTYYPMPFLAKDNIFYYKSAYNMDMFKLIDLIAEVQRHIDQGISTILYVNSEINTRELARYYIYANKKGLKSLYYTRTKRISVEECTSCSV